MKTIRRLEKKRKTIVWLIVFLLNEVLFMILQLQNMAGSEIDRSKIRLIVNNVVCV